MKSKSKPKQSKREIEAALFSADLDWDSAKSGESAIDIFAPAALKETPLPAPTLGELETKQKSDTSHAQTENSNRVQTGSLGFSKRVQTGSANGANRVQTGSAKPSPAHLNPNEPISIRVQTGSDTGSTNGAKAIPLGELSVLRFIADLEAVPGEAVAIRRRDVAGATAQTLEGVKTALKRLSRAGLIELVSFQRGAKTGFTAYKVHPHGREILASKSAISSLGFKRVQTGSDTGSLGFSSSSSYTEPQNLKTTTTGEPELFNDGAMQLSPDWQEVECSPLSGIGFTQTHLVQIIRQNVLKPEVVQQSIYAFAFDLRVNGKAKEVRGAPLNYFMGTLRKGIEYAPPENYETPQAEARRKRIEYLQRAEQQKRDDEQKLLDLEFLSWKRELSESQIVALVPEWARKPGQIQDSALKSHFEENVWPELRTNISGSDENERQNIQKEIQRSLTEATQ